MALLKAAHVSSIPSIDYVPESPSLSLSSPRIPMVQYYTSIGVLKAEEKGTKFMVVGHRGKGMNSLSSLDHRFKEVKENTVLSFNAAAQFPVDFVEFDVQVTKDDCPIIFHDNFILTEENGKILERRSTDLTLEEFLSYGPQKDHNKVGKPLVRKTKDGRVLNWEVKCDDHSCTLQQVFEKVDSKLGFNIELKFDDNLIYQDSELERVLQVILQVVFKYAKDRPIIFSSFQPDAARIMGKLQNTYPVFFLTNGGTQIYADSRRNSLEDAINFCIENKLQGIVSEVKGIFKNPSAVLKIKENNLLIMTYGQLNNVPEAVYIQHLIGINGVIVDFVQEITEAVANFITPKNEEDLNKENLEVNYANRPNFSQREISFLLRLIPELVQ